MSKLNHPFTIHSQCVTSFIYKGLAWPVYTKKNKATVLSRKIMQRLFGILEVGLNQYSKLFMVRLDLHPYEYSPDNKALSRYLERLTVILKQQYRCKVFYVWVREHARGPKQHYHLALFLSGHAIQYPSKLLKMASTEAKRSIGHAIWVQHSFYNMTAKEPASIMPCVYRLSYLAKTETKGKRLAKTKSFNCNLPKLSQLTVNTLDAEVFDWCQPSPMASNTGTPAIVLPMDAGEPPAISTSSNCIVDFSRNKIPLFDPSTGELRFARLFVAALQDSGHVYATACWTNKWKDWQCCHIEMFAAIGNKPDKVNHHRFNTATHPEYQCFADSEAIELEYVGKRSPQLAMLKSVEQYLHEKLAPQMFYRLRDLNQAIQQLVDAHNLHVIGRHTPAELMR